MAVAGALIFGLLLAEMGLRLMGLRPWSARGPDVTIEPGGRMTQPHPTRGYANRPGAFRVTFGDRGTAHCTHLPDGNRITRPPETYDYPSPGPAIWLFGCSVTYGWGLDDEESFPWQLQERLPEYDVQNFAVFGYGTVHSYLQLREALEERAPPAVVVLGYGAFHAERNTLLRGRRKQIARQASGSPRPQPYARLVTPGRVEYAVATPTYRPLPLMRYSALAHLLERQLDKLEERAARPELVARAIVSDFAGACRARGVTFVLAAVYPAEDMLAHGRRMGFATVDIAIDPTDPAMVGPRATSHPSAAAARLYAERLRAFLTREVLSKTDGGTE